MPTTSQDNPDYNWEIRGQKWAIFVLEQAELRLSQTINSINHIEQKSSTLLTLLIAGIVGVLAFIGAISTKSLPDYQLLFSASTCIYFWFEATYKAQKALSTKKVAVPGYAPSKWKDTLENPDDKDFKTMVGSAAEQYEKKINSNKKLLVSANIDLRAATRLAALSPLLAITSYILFPLLLFFSTIPVVINVIILLIIVLLFIYRILQIFI